MSSLDHLELLDHLLYVGCGGACCCLAERAVEVSGICDAGDGGCCIESQATAYGDVDSAVGLRD